MKFLKLIVLCCLILTILGCEPSEDISETDAEVNYGDIFVAGIGQEPVTLNPLFVSDTHSRRVSNTIFNSLISFDHEAKPEAELAESWEINKIKNKIFLHIEKDSGIQFSEFRDDFEHNRGNFEKVDELKKHAHKMDEDVIIYEVVYENNVEEKELNKWLEFNEDIKYTNYRWEVTFYLRDDVKWHDGRNFTSSDVEFTYNKLIDPELETPYSSNYRVVKDVESKGRYEVVVTYFRPILNILRPWGVEIIPEHILENENLEETVFNRNPVGTGPYKMLQWVTADYIIVEANPDYFEGRPYFDKTVFRIIPDHSQRILSLMNGQIDYVELSFDQYKTYGDDLEFEERFNIFKLPYKTGYLYVGYNNHQEFLDNVKVREALSRAINVDELIEGVFLNAATRVTGPYRYQTAAYNEDVPPVPFDPEGAVEILKEEGFVKRDDGFFEKNNNILEISLKTNRGNKEREHMSRYIRRYWKNIGVKTNIELLDWPNFLSDLRAGDFDACMLGWGLGITPDLYQSWHSNSIRWKTDTGVNYIGYQNEEVDRLLEKIRYIPELEEAYEYTQKVHKLIAQDHPYTFLFSEDYIIVMDKRIHGVEVTENETLNSWLEWYVPEELVKYKEGF
ncbi:MAG: ABC transporter substrate-binding protein [Candidatus Muiribacteriota bacterium]